MMSSDEHGFVSLQNFENYFYKTGDISLGVQRIEQLFTIIDTDKKGKLAFEDLEKYFQKFERSPPAKVQKDIVGKISTIKDFFTVANVFKLNICYKSLEIIANKKNEDEEKTVEKLKALQEQASDPAPARWKPFAGFQRIVDGKTLLSAPDPIVREIPPGKSVFKK